MPSQPPPPSSEAALNRMKAIRRSGTDAEARIAEVLRKREIAFESNIKVLEDQRFIADFVLRNDRIAVFVDGCFWHGCPIHGTRAKANREFWDQKISANRERDERAVRAQKQTAGGLYESGSTRTQMKRPRSFVR